MWIKAKVVRRGGGFEGFTTLAPLPKKNQSYTIHYVAVALFLNRDWINLVKNDCIIIKFHLYGKIEIKKGINWSLDQLSA